MKSSEAEAVISVIIPTLNESDNLGRLVSQLRRQDAALEIIVVDGGSRDGTIAAARHDGAIIMHMNANRGAQLRAGALVARGDILLFLHADSEFPEGGLSQLARALAASPEAGGGNFRLLFDGGSGFARWLTGFYGWLRARGFYYGDSGVFVRRKIYHELGGVRPLDLMEDYDFIRRMERAGPTICIDDPPLVTSSRRFEGRRPAAIVAGWLVIHALFYMRVPSRALARLYYRRSDSRGTASSC